MSRILVAVKRWQLVVLLEKALQQQGWETVTAINRDGITQLINAGTIDLLILDLDLLVEDSLNILKEANSCQKQLPILMITSFDELGNRAANVINGMGEVLSHPFGLRTLIERVNVWLNYY